MCRVNPPKNQLWQTYRPIRSYTGILSRNSDINGSAAQQMITRTG
jgi:hypothetical protein